MASSLFSTGESFARAIPSDSNSSATTDYSVGFVTKINAFVALSEALH